MFEVKGFLTVLIISVFVLLSVLAPSGISEQLHHTVANFSR